MSASASTGRGARRGQALDGGRLLAGIGALVLLVGLFLDWWGPPEGGFGPGSTAGITGWNAFEFVDIALAALALATLALAAESVLRPGRERLPGAVGAAAGPVALVLVAVSLINEPPVVLLSAGDPDAGAWLALAGALVMTIGALLRYARISISVTPRERAPASPDAETRPLAEEPRTPPR